MSIGLFVKQKKFIDAELKKGNKNYEEIYQKAKEKQAKENKLADKLLKNTMGKLEKEGIVKKEE